METLDMSESVATGIAGSALAAPGITVLVGHAGVGKTNLALNLVLAQARAGLSVTLADLDLVNPYFRSSDYNGALEAAGVRLIAPLFARTALDTPSMGGELDGAIAAVGASPARTTDGVAGASTAQAPRLVIDVGGDDLGATALGRYARALQAAGARLLYVVSAFRTLTSAPQEAIEVLRAIEGHAHLRAGGVVNCSNLADQTSAADIEQGRTFARAVAELAGLPLVATIAPANLRGALSPAEAPGAPAPTPASSASAQPPVPTPAPAAASATGSAPVNEPLIFVERFVRPPWE